MKGSEEGLVLTNESSACGIGGVVSLDGAQSAVTTRQLLEVLSCMPHRGGYMMLEDNNPPDGDGAGLLLDLPREFFADELAALEPALAKSLFSGQLAVGMLYLPTDDGARKICMSAVERCLVRTFSGDVQFAWRRVPVDDAHVGVRSRGLMPAIWQILVVVGKEGESSKLELELFAARRAMKHAVVSSAREHQNPELFEHFYVCSLSARTIVYKGMLTGAQVGCFFSDLTDSRFETSYGLVHERFATNTSSRWKLAQPFRWLCHNGEINTWLANTQFMKALEQTLDSHLGDEMAELLKPLLSPDLSDSGVLDNTLELLTLLTELSAPEVLSVLMPYAWESDVSLSAEERAFWEYWATVLPPWNGPAAVFFDSSRYIGARLNTNGFRPLRADITVDGMVVFASEANILKLSAARVGEKRPIGPGESIIIDKERREVRYNGQLVREWASNVNYRQLVAPLVDCPHENHFEQEVGSSSTDIAEEVAEDGALSIVARAISCGWTKGEVEQFLLPATSGKGPLSSMGDDSQVAALRPLDELQSTIFNFVLERFSQVTNPPIDFIRESLVMSLTVYLGARRSVFAPIGKIPQTYRLNSPVLMPGVFGWICSQSEQATLSNTFDRGSMEDRLEGLCAEMDDIIESGSSIVVVSDKALSQSRRLVPMLLAVSYLDLHLVKTGRRGEVSIVVETAEVKSSHDLAVLLGYGASAVYPYAGYQLIERTLRETPSRLSGQTLAQSLAGYVASLEYGLKKTMSKMGVHTLSSYISGRIFETLGVDGGFAEKYLGEARNISPVGGYRMREIAVMYGAMHRTALAVSRDPSALELEMFPDTGRYRYKRRAVSRSLEPEVVFRLQQAARAESDLVLWQRFNELANSRQTSFMHNLELCLEKRESTDANQIDEREIYRAIRTSPMSYGSISPEAHELLALAASTLGFMSGSGEGGEDRRRLYTPFSSAIKQVASGRFGVHAEYLLSARVIEIKMAQGAKPGEGGQLGWEKVSAEIAVLRGTEPHVLLTSPPPHHDIYSIEDLAQLIHDLKLVNPEAQICVKLVSSRGIGTVSVGVAKAGADIIHIAGHSGGTGNAPVSSIHFAGLPVELGLSEVHQSLLVSGIRDNVVLGCDGGLLTGRDVVVLALLGAQIFGFGTAALVASGCVMTRRCHLNDCPVGVATTNPELRRLFSGEVRHVTSYFKNIAAETRRYLSQLGCRSLGEAIGRTDLLGGFSSSVFDSSRLLHRPKPSWAPKVGDLRTLRNSLRSVASPLESQILELCSGVIENGAGEVSLVGSDALSISTADLSVGARISSVITRRHRNRGLGSGKIAVEFRGAAGQSFGAWLPSGVSFSLVGEANDGVAKGLTGGNIVIKPPSDAAFVTEQSAIVGNSVLYGANGGKLFARGIAGQRFGVLNKNAQAVVEGASWHFCEYMCGGLVVSLAPVGRNAFAGMSGGVSVVYDDTDEFIQARCNRDTVELRRLANIDCSVQDAVRELIAEHFERTESPKANYILKNWKEATSKFVVATARVVDEAQRDAQRDAMGEYRKLMAEIEDDSSYNTPERLALIAEAERMSV